MYKNTNTRDNTEKKQARRENNSEAIVQEKVSSDITFDFSIGSERKKRDEKKGELFCCYMFKVQRNLVMVSVRNYIHFSLLCFVISFSFTDSFIYLTQFADHF